MTRDLTNQNDLVMNISPVQDAKARFCVMPEACATYGPQMVPKRRIAAAVLKGIGYKVVPASRSNNGSSRVASAVSAPLNPSNKTDAIA
ncbi:hypothetical protein [Sphingobium baderi]|uniref:hypothetical protein n=1 Tax=Sphingobium baderi TaxID=1332080 RepID=UPI0011E0172F|nr:hypothetical protein [Sphingobium baderi]